MTKQNFKIGGCPELLEEREYKKCWKTKELVWCPQISYMQRKLKWADTFSEINRDGH